MMAHDDDGIDTRTVGLVALIAVVALVLTVIGLQAWYLRVERREGETKQVGASLAAQAHAIKQRQRQAMNETRWVDRDRGVVAIPIDRAIDLVVQRAAAEAAGREETGREETGREAAGIGVDPGGGR